MKEQNSESYRPIYLINSWMKVLVVNQIVQCHLHNTQWMANAQNGFTSGRSNRDTIQSIVDRIYIKRREEKHVCIISMDISSAFNSICYPEMLNNLVRVCCLYIYIIYIMKTMKSLNKFLHRKRSSKSKRYKVF